MSRRAGERDTAATTRQVSSHEPDDKSPMAARLVTLQQTVGNAALARAITRLAPLTRTSAAGSMLMRNPDLGALAAQAARELPRGINFGSWMPERSLIGGEDPIRLNPRFWTLRYYLVRNDGRRSEPFESWEEVLDFVADRASWDGSKLIVRVRPNGDADAALEDLFSPASAREYALDCFLAAALIQFRAIHLQFLGELQNRRLHFQFDESRSLRARTQFNARYGRHVLRAEGTFVQGMATGLGLQEVDIGANVRLSKLNELAPGRLRVGDLVTIENPFMDDEDAFRRENATYLGRDRVYGHLFHGHPLGVFDARGYALGLISQRQAYLGEKSAEWVMRWSYVSRKVYRPPHRPRRTGVRMTGASQER